MPASARLPSGTRVEVLCGQPEQKYGCAQRHLGAGAARFSLRLERARSRWRARRRRSAACAAAMARAMCPA
jgi:hypothetical protein